jgi:hypothetical protein
MQTSTQPYIEPGITEALPEENGIHKTIPSMA